LDCDKGVGSFKGCDSDGSDSRKKGKAALEGGGVFTELSGASAMAGLIAERRFNFTSKGKQGVGERPGEKKRKSI